MSFVKGPKVEGHGYIGVRLEIEGWPYEFVSHPQMALTRADGRQRVACLLADGIDYEHLCDVAFLELDGSAPTIKIAEPDDPTLTGVAMLAPYPNEHGVLNDETTDSDTTLDFTQTVSTPSVNDVIHVGQEAMRVTGTSPFTVTRGIWSSYARYHYQVSENTSNAIYPLVLDNPAGMEGRRAKLFLYGGIDEVDTEYAGYPIWRGKVLGSPSWNGDGTWDIPMGRLDEIYNIGLSKGLSQDLVPRGVHHGDTFTVSGVVKQYPSAAFENITLTQATGFWETQADFLTALDASFAADLSAQAQTYGLSTVATDIVDENLAHPLRGLIDVGSWCLKITISTTCWAQFATSDSIEPVWTYSGDDSVGYGPAIFNSSKTFVDYMPISTIGSPSNGYLFTPGTYYVVADPKAHEALEPTFGDAAPHPGGGLVPRRDENETIYLSKVYSVAIDPGGSGEGTLLRVQSPDEDIYTQKLVSSYDHSQARIVSAADMAEYTPFYETSYQLVAAYGWNRESTIGEIVSRDFVNFCKHALPGDSPPLFTDDVQDFDTEAFIASWATRQLYLTSDVGLLEVIAPDLIAEGKMLYYKTDGSIGIRDVPSLTTATSGFTIGDGDIVEAPTIEPFGKIGVTNVYEFEFDYDWQEDKYFNRLIARDVPSVSAHGERRSKGFSWQSTERQTQFSGPSRAELEDLAQAYFDIFGSKVYLVTCSCTLKQIDADIGDVAELTLSELPNPKTGRFGIDAWSGLLIGRRVSPMQGLVVLQFITRGDEL